MNSISTRQTAGQYFNFIHPLSESTHYGSWQARLPHFTVQLCGAFAHAYLGPANYPLHSKMELSCRSRERKLREKFQLVCGHPSGYRDTRAGQTCQGMVMLNAMVWLCINTYNRPLRRTWLRSVIQRFHSRVSTGIDVATIMQARVCYPISAIGDKRMGCRRT